jgi:5-methylcytosine-specific restriction protein A
MPMTPDQLRALAETASQVYDGHSTRVEGIQSLVQEYDINQGSAGLYIDNYKNLLEGKVIKRNMRSAIIDYFLTHIFEKRGRLAHSKALEAVEQHIEHLEERNDSEKHTMRAVVTEHLNKYY